MPFVAFLFLLVGLVITVYSLWADGRSGRHRAMAIAGVLLAWWALCMIMVYGAEKSEEALSWYQMSLSGILFLIPAVYWVYLDQAGLRAWIKWLCTAVMVLFGVVLYFGYGSTSFYFTGFRPGPWGNVGIVTTQSLWYLIASGVYQVTTIIMVVVMFRCRAKASSSRLRSLYGANAFGLIISMFIFGFAFVVETYFAWPPMDMIAAGFYLIGVNFYLMGRYRYLQREPMVDINQIGGHVSEALLVLDAQLRIITANPSAQKLLGTAETDLRGLVFPSLLDNANTINLAWQDTLHKKQNTLSLQAERNRVRLDLNLAPHFDKFGDVCGAVVVLRSAPEGTRIDAEWGLTAREVEILDLVLQGWDNKTIASTLFVSLGTVKNHLYSIYKKLRVESRLELMNAFRTTGVRGAG